MPARQATVILLAAGKGLRFLASGGQQHKLHALIGERTVFEHTLNAVIASGLPYVVVRPGHNPTGGMGGSIAAGVRMSPDAAGWLVLPADLPLILPDTLLTVAQHLASVAGQQLIVVPQHKGQQAHPVGFSRHYFDALNQLSGEQGAKRLFAPQWVKLLAVNDPGSAADIDTVADLDRIAVAVQTQGCAAHEPPAT